MKSSLNELPLRVNVIISHRNDKACIELRRVISDPELIKEIIKATLYHKNFIVLPQFFDLAQSISSLVEKGIIYYDNNKKQYNFTF